jgi:RNA polymerase sigma factor (sigma-70 family)
MAVVEGVDQLLGLCRQGDEDAVRALVLRFRVRALDLATALLGDEHRAEDAVQEAFLAALRRLGDLRDPSAFPAWFRQVVRSQCTRVLRKRRERLDPEIDDAPVGTASPLANAELEETRSIVRKALASLPTTERRTAQLFYLEERSCADIADDLRVPLGTVKRRLHDARERLRAMLLGYVAAEKRDERPGAGLPL